MEAMQDGEESYRLDYIDDALSALPSWWGEIVARTSRHAASSLAHMHVCCDCVVAQVMREMHICVRAEFVLLQSAQLDTSELRAFCNVLLEKLRGKGKLWPTWVLGPPTFSCKIKSFEKAVEKILLIKDPAREIEHVRTLCIGHLKNHTDYLAKVGSVSLLGFFRGEGVVTNAGKVAALEHSSAKRRAKHDSGRVRNYAAESRAARSHSATPDPDVDRPPTPAAQAAAQSGHGSTCASRSSSLASFAWPFPSPPPATSPINTAASRSLPHTHRDAAARWYFLPADRPRVRGAREGAGSTPSPIPPAEPPWR